MVEECGRVRGGEVGERGGRGEAAEECVAVCWEGEVREERKGGDVQRLVTSVKPEEKPDRWMDLQ